VPYRGAAKFYPRALHFYYSTGEKERLYPWKQRTKACCKDTAEKAQLQPLCSWLMYRAANKKTLLLAVVCNDTFGKNETFAIEFFDRFRSAQFRSMRQKKSLAFFPSAKILY